MWKLAYAVLAIALGLLPTDAISSNDETTCLEPADGAQISLDRGYPKVKLKWSETGRTRIQFSTQADFTPLLFDKGVPCCEVQMRGVLDPGHYYWRIQSEDDKGNRQELCRASFEIVS